jgi:hypothetical protein
MESKQIQLTVSDVSALLGSRLTLAYHSRQSDSSSCDAVPACDAKLMSWRSNMIPNNESNLLRGRTVDLSAWRQ